MIGLTITTSKRLSLFKKTIESFALNCLDLELFDIIIHYDDSSSNEDRNEMSFILKKLFPNKIIISRNFNEESFVTKKRHANIMKMWKDDIKLSNLSYVFHLEDDWFFEKHFKLVDGIKILKSRDDIALIGYSWKKKEFPLDFFIPEIIDSYWEWFYSDKYNLNEPLMYDIVEMEYLPDGHWVKIVNWPYFGFRPAIHDVVKLNTLSNFKTDIDNFELEFAQRFGKKYKSFLHLERIAYHIGNEVSSYDLNNSDR